MENHQPTNPTPNDPDEGQKAQPQAPDTEINPAKPANDTEVDLDKSRTETYPKTTPPERH